MENNQSPEQLNTKTTENTLRVIIVVLIISTILAVLGTGLGIYSTITANQLLSKYNEDNSEGMELESEFVDEPEYSKPENIDDINYIGITYNNGKDFIDIVRDEEGNYIEYYTFDNNDEYVGEIAENANIDDIFGYVFEKDLDKFGEESFLGDVSWGVEISSTDGSCYVSGNSDQPDWLNALLKKLDADSKGYKHNTL